VHIRLEDPDSIEVAVSGFSDKLPALAEKVFQVLDRRIATCCHDIHFRLVHEILYYARDYPRLT
jgi:hypothetical protein